MFTPDYYVDATTGEIMIPRHYFCKSLDTKETVGIPNGSDCIEMDTSKIYFFDAEDGEWLEWGATPDAEDATPDAEDEEE